MQKHYGKRSKIRGYAWHTSRSSKSCKTVENNTFCITQTKIFELQHFSFQKRAQTVPPRNGGISSLSIVIMLLIVTVRSWRISTECCSLLAKVTCRKVVLVCYARGMMHKKRSLCPSSGIGGVPLGVFATPVITSRHKSVMKQNTNVNSHESLCLSNLISFRIPGQQTKLWTAAI